jgi:glucokinase
MKYFIGIDIGGTNIKGAIVSETGILVDFYSINSIIPDGNVVLDSITQIISILIDKSIYKKTPITAIGIGTPGVVNEKQGCVIEGCPNIPGWKNIKFIPILKEKFNLPVFANNDVNLMALGELFFGSAKGKQHVICLTLGTGIGGGIIINGKLYEGKNNYAGEIGHTCIIPNGRTCKCESNGCLEAYASATGIITSAKEYIFKNPESDFSKIINQNPNNLDVKFIFELAEKGNPIAKQIFTETCLYLGIGIANLINIFNPEMIIIGGGISQAGEMLFTPVKEIASQYGFNLSFQNTEIVPAKFVEKSGVIGAAAYALSRI